MHLDKQLYLEAIDLKVETIRDQYNKGIRNTD